MRGENMILTVLIAALAACGAFLIFWAIAQAMLLPLPQEGTYCIICLCGSTAQVEQLLRSALWQRERRGFRGSFLFLSDALTQEQLLLVRRRLEREDGARLCRAEEVTQIVQRETENIGTGSH